MARTAEKTKAVAAAEVLAAAATAAAHVAAGQADRIDHDAIIRLETQVATLTAQSTQNAADATARASRIEEKVTAGFERVNGSVTRHEQLIHDLERRPVTPLTDEDATEMKTQVAKMWSAFSLAKMLLAVFIVEQPVVVGAVLAILFKSYH